ncbi:GntR family transcriptional regulator [Pelagibacterium sediminicola]|uniref:GntR family transcriptional regulator n=1 Tax=Pelagibacterium sediminicola TaxID=2248761 RepID=UPI001FEC1A3A|nr:GntR family transcriptional regulator [Pelagibacterium sediminicola]
MLGDDNMVGGSAQHRRMQSEIVLEGLEAEIIAGIIPPGTRLDETGIGDRFGVSRTPVREALHALCARSLAERVPYKGVLVLALSPEHIDQMFEAMAEMEATCGRLASQRMTMSERAELETMHREMNALADAGDYETYEGVNSRFHTLIVAGCHNKDLVALAESMRAKLRPFRKYQLHDRGRISRSCAEHQDIVDALLDQDAQRAGTALRRHLVSAAQEFLLRRKGEVEA